MCFPVTIQRGLKRYPKKSAFEYLGTDKYIQSHKLKQKLIEEGIKEHCCEICKLTEWNGQPIPIELDHINGVNSDNRLENLRILCPNCHAQTPTHAGKNIKDKNKNIICPECKGKKYRRASLCRNCNNLKASKNRTTKIDWPPKEDLQKMVDDTNYSAAGRLLGVSDNAVRKRLRG